MTLGGVAKMEAMVRQQQNSKKEKKHAK